MKLAETIDVLFDRLDAWRYLPNYQLERRSDIFFSLYLPAVLSAKYGVEIDQRIVPELPLRHGSLSKGSQGNRSYKVDYFCLSADKTIGYLVELKTDQSSRRTTQDEYLKAAKKARLPKILFGLKEIFIATKAKRKYFHLFALLEELGLATLPPEFRNYMRKSNLVGLTSLVRKIEIAPLDPSLEIVYLQPSGKDNEEKTINFDYFANHLRGLDDLFAARFAYSLETWGSTRAGTIKNEQTAR